MQVVPLYPDPPRAAIEVAPPHALDHGCQLCARHASAKSVCIAAEGDPGGAFFVGEGPGRQEDLKGRPFAGESGRLLRNAISRSKTSLPIAFDNALRCYSVTTTHEDHITACRGYLAQTLREVNPSRVIALGVRAVVGLLGRSVPIMSVRRGYGWLYNDGDPIPVFLLPNPAAGLRNRFVRKWIETDIRWALNTPIPDLPPWDEKVNVVQTAEDAEAACAALRAGPWFGFDTETFGIAFEPHFQVVTFAACVAGSDEAWAWGAVQLQDPACLAPLQRLLADPSVPKVGQNLKFDGHAARCGLGVELQNYHGDPRLWRKLLAADVNAKLEVMSELVGMGGMKAEADAEVAKASKLIAKERGRSSRGMLLPGIDPMLEAAVKFRHEKPKRFAYGFMDPKIRTRYCARDAVAATRLGVTLEKQLNGHPPLRRVWDEIACGANEALEQVEAWGIAASKESAQNFNAYLGVKQTEMSKRLEQYGKFNPDSPAQVADLLFKKLGLKPPKVLESGHKSTDKDVLELLQGKHPVVEDLEAWRGLARMRSQYAAGMIPHIRSDGRIHPSVKLDGARTGRTSCENPNLQNIRRSEEEEDPDSRMARDVFVAPPGYVLVNVDYKQLELRVATMLSQDPQMKAIWEEGLDYHLRTAQLISKLAWGIPPEQVVKYHRQTAKTLNFRIFYGGGPKGVARSIGCTVEEADRIMRAILGAFSGYDVWRKAQIDEARRTGYVWTWWAGQRARRRPLLSIASEDNQSRSNAERAAANTPVQGTASDFCIASLVECVRWIREDAVPAKLVLPVHDSLLFEVREDAVAEVAFQASRIMQQWDSLGITLDVDVETGPAWGSLSPYKLAEAA